MIAEYERAQIAERCRRGKRHRAQQGSISVLSGAPYGYRYVKKSDTAAAYYEVLESEAAIVRQVYEAYTRQGLSISAIARMLNERRIPTRTETTRWERSTVWGLLRNPAYRDGRAMARPKSVHASESRDRCGSATGWPAAIAPITNGHARTGSISPFPPWSARRPSRWPKNSWSGTNGIRPGARLSRPCYRDAGL